MAPLAPTADPLPQRALHRAHRALEGELRALLRKDRADAILEKALETVLSDPGADLARQLRSIVGARLLDEIADLLTRVEKAIEVDSVPGAIQFLAPTPEPVRLDEAIDEREGRARVQRRWTAGSGVARRIVG